MTTNYTLAEAIIYMRSRGFVTTFTIQNGSIFCPELNTTISPDSLILLEKHVVEALDKKSKREVYGFKTKENVLGIMTDTYADYDHQGFNFIFQQHLQKQSK